MKPCYFLFFIYFAISCNQKVASPADNVQSHSPTGGSFVHYSYTPDPTNTLEKKVETLRLEYIVWGCACAPWITPEDHIKYEDSGMIAHAIFIEPANESPNGMDTMDFMKYDIRVTGSFYTKKDYPKGIQPMEEKMEKARVFRYTNIEFIKR